MTTYLLTLAGVLGVYMHLWFIASLVRKRNDVADVAWGLGFVLLAWTSLVLGGQFTAVGMLTTLLVTVWGLRLAIHIYARNKGKSEDKRYQAWRAQWGKWVYVRSYLQVFILQGVLLFLVVSPVLVLNKSADLSFGWLTVVGLCVWATGFFFEAVGDWQLAQFLAQPANKGKLLMSGLWAYTRHPNYFGEVTQWWGIWLMALSAPMGWVAIIGPITITVLILGVSGVPMLEKSMASHPDFAAYKQRVSKFIPLPPA